MDEWMLKVFEGLNKERFSYTPLWTLPEGCTTLAWFVEIFRIYFYFFATYFP